jgi:hypothetical protein
MRKFFEAQTEGGHFLCAPLLAPMTDPHYVAFEVGFFGHGRRSRQMNGATPQDFNVVGSRKTQLTERI